MSTISIPLDVLLNAATVLEEVANHNPYTAMPDRLRADAMSAHVLFGNAVRRIVREQEVKVEA